MAKTAAVVAKGDSVTQRRGHKIQGWKSTFVWIHPSNWGSLVEKRGKKTIPELGVCSSGAEGLPNMSEALGSILSATNQNPASTPHLLCARCAYLVLEGPVRGG